VVSNNNTAESTHLLRYKKAPPLAPLCCFTDVLGGNVKCKIGELGAETSIHCKD
jgi:hypothetical protein